MNLMKAVLNMQKIRLLEERDEKLTAIWVFSSQPSDVINIATFQFSPKK